MEILRSGLERRQPLPTRLTTCWVEARGKTAAASIATEVDSILSLRDKQTEKVRPPRALYICSAPPHRTLSNARMKARRANDIFYCGVCDHAELHFVCNCGEPNLVISTGRRWARSTFLRCSSHLSKERCHMLKLRRTLRARLLSAASFVRIATCFVVGCALGR